MAKRKVLQYKVPKPKAVRFPLGKKIVVPKLKRSRFFK